MHIGLIGSCLPDSFLSNIGDALARLGHRVTHVRIPGHERGPRWLTRNSKRALAAVPNLEQWVHRRACRSVLEQECDAVITTNGYLLPDVVTQLRCNRVPVVLWYPDAVVNMGSQRMLMAPYTAVFFKEPLLVDRLRRAVDLPVAYLPQACNPRWHRPIGEAGVHPKIAVVGNMYPSRVLLLRRLRSANVPIVVFGSPPGRWAQEALGLGVHTGTSVFREEKSRVFRSHAAVLNNLHPGEMHGLNLRLFEATAAGGAVLCERRPTLGDLYDTDTEVLPYESFDELVDQARAVLGAPVVTEKIGDAASRRAHAEHSYEARLPVILEKLA